MVQSIVYYVDSRAPVKEVKDLFQRKFSLVNKLERLVEESELLDDFIEKGDVVALKTHFGIHGTTKPLRPVFIRKISEIVQRRGGFPFITETTGLGMIYDQNTHIGRLKIAEENGYTPQTLSAPIIIADGLKGFNGRKIIVDGLQLKEVYIAELIAEADKIITLTHVTGHMQGSLGGAIKNIGLGCISKPSKYDVHLYEPPIIDNNKCDNCMKCVEICSFNAIKNKDNSVEIDPSKCGKCLGCWEICEKEAIITKFTTSKDMCERMVDCVKAIHDKLGSGKFRYINFLVDITPHCDCHSYSDNAVVPDIGVLASEDIVAIDKASADLIYKAPALENSMGSGLGFNSKKFENIFSQTDFEYQLKAAESLKLGCRNYILKKLEI